MKRPSFQFYPADWKGSRWITFDGEFPTRIPNIPACYVVYLDGALSYVGQTRGLRKRIYGHKIDLCRYSNHINSVWGQFNSITIKARFATKHGDWATRELRLIDRLQPELNCVGSVKRRARA